MQNDCQSFKDWQSFYKGGKVDLPFIRMDFYIRRFLFRLSLGLSGGFEASS